MDQLKLEQSDLILLHSPLNLMAQFVLLLQHRFSQGNLPWQFHSDENRTGIFIHTEYNYPQETANAYPCLSVGRGAVVHGRAVVADHDQSNPHIIARDSSYHWGTGECDIRIQCGAENRGEATALGDVVQSLVGMSRGEICRQFTLLDVSPVVLQPTQPFDRDKEKWACSVDFRVFFEHRWFNLNVQPELRSLTLYTQSAVDGLAYVRKAILKSTSTGT